MFDGCLYFNLSSLSRTITEIWKDEFSQLGLSPSHGYLLFAMVEKSGVQQKDYGDYLDLDASTINRLIDILIQKGYAEKDGVGRGSVVSVTPQGRELYRKVKKSMSSLKQQMTEGLGKAKFEKLVQDLAMARDTLSA